MSDGEWHQNRGIRSELETQEAAERRGAGWWFLSSGQAEDQIPGGQFQGGGVGQRGGRFGGGVQSAGGRSSVQFSCSVVSDSLWSHVLQQARLPCLSSTLRVYSNSCPSSWWCHPTISPSVVPFSSCLQSSPASGSFPVSHFFASGGQRIGVSASASVLPMNIKDWFPLGLTDWIPLQFKGLSKASSPTSQFKSINSLVLSFLYSPTLTSIHDYWKNHSFD